MLSPSSYSRLKFPPTVPEHTDSVEASPTLSSQSESLKKTVSFSHSSDHRGVSFLDALQLSPSGAAQELCSCPYQYTLSDCILEHISSREHKRGHRKSVSSVTPLPDISESHTHKEFEDMPSAPLATISTLLTPAIHQPDEDHRDTCFDQYQQVKAQLSSMETDISLPVSLLDSKKTSYVPVLPLSYCLSPSGGLPYLVEFASSKYCDELLQFYEHVQRFRQLLQSGHCTYESAATLLTYIMHTYLLVDSPKEVNIASYLRLRSLKTIQLQQTEGIITMDVLDEVTKEVFKMIKTEVYKPFISQISSTSVGLSAYQRLLLHALTALTDYIDKGELLFENDVITNPIIQCMLLQYVRDDQATNAVDFDMIISQTQLKHGSALMENLFNFNQSSSNSNSPLAQANSQNVFKLYPPHIQITLCKPWLKGAHLEDIVSDTKHVITHQTSNGKNQSGYEANKPIDKQNYLQLGFLLSLSSIQFPELQAHGTWFSLHLLAGLLPEPLLVLFDQAIAKSKPKPNHCNAIVGMVKDIMPHFTSLISAETQGYLPKGYGTSYCLHQPNRVCMACQDYLETLTDSPPTYISRQLHNPTYYQVEYKTSNQHWKQLFTENILKKPITTRTQYIFKRHDYKRSSMLTKIGFQPIQNTFLPLISPKMHFTDSVISRARKYKKAISRIYKSRLTHQNNAEETSGSHLVTMKGGYNHCSATVKETEITTNHYLFQTGSNATSGDNTVFPSNNVPVSMYKETLPIEYTEVESHAEIIKTIRLISYKRSLRDIYTPPQSNKAVPEPSPYRFPKVVEISVEAEEVPSPKAGNRTSNSLLNRLSPRRKMINSPRSPQQLTGTFSFGCMGKPKKNYQKMSDINHLAQENRHLSPLPLTEQIDSVGLRKMLCHSWNIHQDPCYFCAVPPQQVRSVINPTMFFHPCDATNYVRLTPSPALSRLFVELALKPRVILTNLSFMIPTANIHVHNLLNNMYVRHMTVNCNNSTNVNPHASSLPTTGKHVIYPSIEINTPDQKRYPACKDLLPYLHPVSFFGLVQQTAHSNIPISYPTLCNIQHIDNNKEKQFQPNIKLKPKEEQLHVALHWKLYLIITKDNIYALMLTVEKANTISFFANIEDPCNVHTHTVTNKHIIDPEQLMKTILPNMEAIQKVCFLLPASKLHTTEDDFDSLALRITKILEHSLTSYLSDYNGADVNNLSYQDVQLMETILSRIKQAQCQCQCNEPKHNGLVKSNSTVQTNQALHNIGVAVGQSLKPLFDNWKNTEIYRSLRRDLVKLKKVQTLVDTPCKKCKPITRSTSYHRHSKICEHRMYENNKSLYHVYDNDNNQEEFLMSSLYKNTAMSMNTKSVGTQDDLEMYTSQNSQLISRMTFNKVTGKGPLYCGCFCHIDSHQRSFTNAAIRNTYSELLKIMRSFKSVYN